MPMPHPKPGALILKRQLAAGFCFFQHRKISRNLLVVIRRISEPSDSIFSYCPIEKCTFRPSPSNPCISVTSTVETCIGLRMGCACGAPGRTSLQNFVWSTLGAFACGRSPFGTTLILQEELDTIQAPECRGSLGLVCKKFEARPQEQSRLGVVSSRSEQTAKISVDQARGALERYGILVRINGPLLVARLQEHAPQSCPAHWTGWGDLRQLSEGDLGGQLMTRYNQVSQ
jgi:hypothetical protein